MENKHYLFIGLTLVAALLLSLTLRKLIHLYTRQFGKKIKTDPTNFSFLKNSISFIIYTAAFIVIFSKVPILSNFSKAIFAGAGILAAIVGFAAQNSLSNIISGLFIIMFKPFRVGDTINIDLQKGVVEDITLRHTVIKDYENRRIIIPNSIISNKTIVNSSIADERIKRHVEFGISFTSNLDKAIEIIRAEASNHPLCLDNRNDDQKLNNAPKVLVRVIAWADFSIRLRAYVWSNNNDDAFILKCDLLKSVKERFDSEGIEIPFPYQNVIIKNNTI